MIKILTDKSIENTNIDGARANHFSAGMKSGIVKGALNEGNFFASASNAIALDSCELRVSGHQVIIDTAQFITLSNTPSKATRYSLIAEIKVDDGSVPAFRLFVQSVNAKLTQDNLFKTLNGVGTYQLCIGNFTLNTDGTITDVVRTADLITGGDNDGPHINIGKITTQTLASNLKAEVDVEERYDETVKKNVLDFTFGIPKGSDAETKAYVKKGTYDGWNMFAIKHGASTENFSNIVFCSKELQSGTFPLRMNRPFSTFEIGHTFYCGVNLDINYSSQVEAESGYTFSVGTDSDSNFVIRCFKDGVEVNSLANYLAYNLSFCGVCNNPIWNLIRE